MKLTEDLILTDAQFKAELWRCEQCEEQPCRTGCLEGEPCGMGCPANVSPADFIMAARGGNPLGYPAVRRPDHDRQPAGRSLRNGLPG